MAEALLHAERGGSGSGPTLLLVHGSGANGAVWHGWKPFLDTWNGRWIVPDLRGHGRSFHRAPYGPAIHAADLAALLKQDEEVVLVGHSMGGAVSLVLGCGLYGISVKRIFAFGARLSTWQPEDIAKARAASKQPARLFATREEALERYLKVSGLFGLRGPDTPEAAVGVVEEGGQFRLAADPASTGAAGADIRPLLPALTMPVHLAAGAEDKSCPRADLVAIDPDAVQFEGCGHNPHVEKPTRVWQWIRDRL